MLFADRPHFKRYVTLSAVLGFAVFMVYLLFFTDFMSVGSIIGGTNIAIYALAFLCVLAASAFDALAWKSTLDNLSVKTTFRRVFSLSWVGHFVDTLVPGGLAGDAFKTYMLSKDKDINGSKAVASIIIKDVLELVVVLASLVVGIVLLAFNYSVNSVMLTAIGVTMILLALPLVLIVYLSLNVHATEKVLGAVQQALNKIKGTDTSNSAIHEKLHKQVKEFREGVLSIKSNPRVMIKPIMFQSLTWVFEVLAFFCVFAALGSIISLDKVVITNTIVSNVQGQGVALAGIANIVSSELYIVLGITRDLAGASSLLAGFSSFWFKLVLSFTFFQIAVFDRCVPFVCNKCFGWTAWRTKSCPEPKPKKQKT